MRLACFYALLSCLSLPALGAQWQSLLDPSLSQWDTYLSYKHKESYDGSMPLDENGNAIPPIGLNTGNDTYQVFTVSQEDGQPVLRVSGEIYGAVTSKESYRNYHLRLKFRWGQKKWPPRENMLRDSGILYHAIGEHGQEYYRSWMLSQEFQIMRGHIGDYWQQASSAIDIRAYPPEYIMNPVADETQPFIKVGKGEAINGFVMRKENAEKPFGQWNTLELICFEGQSLHIVNGQVVMVLKNSRYLDDGINKPLVEGKIQLQSEAAEVFYKQIEIKALASLPAQYTGLFSEGG
ncbi:MAG: DUF1080 domain-containing protein [Paraglaciecola sp.]|nr:DUF1080 domain-containing protein [Paraglaciecola sp.]NCT48646.1 DUF1080 domain-containing protein [Paraglaciecola sp.]